MNSIKRTIVAWEKHEEQVEFTLPCYRKWKDLRVYKITSEDSFLSVTLASYLNPQIELSQGSIDRAFDRDTEEATAEEFDDAFAKCLAKITDVIHQ
jgi:hypothetical protein